MHIQQEQAKLGYPDCILVQYWEFETDRILHQICAQLHYVIVHDRDGKAISLFEDVDEPVIALKADNEPYDKG